MGPGRERAGGMFTGLCARAKRRVGLQRNSVEGGRHGRCWGAQDSTTLFPKWCLPFSFKGSQTLTCRCL